MPVRLLFAAVLAVALAAPLRAADPPKLSVLYLGDNGHHKPADRFKQLQPVLAARNIALTYTDTADDLNPATLGKYDGLMVYANIDAITPPQEKALLDFVAGGKGFIPLHCASYCFRNSDAVVALIGGQFRSHTTGTFRATAVAPDHPIMKGYGGFTSWDETYVHTKHNEKDRTVLEVRTDGDVKEPWTWVRTHGKGRVFYTAWGHDQRTFGNPGFHNLVERGVRWACGQDPALTGAFADRPEPTAKRTDLKPFEYTEAKIPNYSPRGGRSTDERGKMQKPLSVEESVKHYVTPKGFSVRPFVTEEKLGGKPVAMTWDERGRLWLALTKDYPNELQREGEGRDKIVVCEDTDGDGVADTVTTFADKLSIPTSLLPFRGGLVVTQAPHTLFLKDTDGDGTADLRQVLFTGWGTGDTHAGPSNLRYGFDNWVYGSVGYSAFRGEVGGETVSFRQGYYRFKLEPDGSDPHKLKTTKVEFLRSTSNNTWGFGFDEAGRMFGSTANGCALVHLPIPNRYYEKVKGLTPSVLAPIIPDNHIEPITANVRQVDWHGGFTAAAGCTVYTARTYPAEYWNKTAFVTEPTGHLAATFVLTPDGADFRGRYGWNLVASDDEWAAPIDTTVGPDGHVWVLDWYNFIVQHNPTPQGFQTGKGNAYETDLRDKSKGRIYRVVYEAAKTEKPFTLKDASPEKLVETLSHPNLTWRLHAQRLLVERGKKDVVPALKALANDPKADGPAVIHALATLDGLDTPEPNRALAALSHSSAGVRVIALRSVAARKAFDAETIAQVGKLAATDADARVRTEALLALADGTDATGPAFGQAIAAALGRADNLTDPNVRVALTAAAAQHAWVTYTAVAKTPLTAPALDVLRTAIASMNARDPLVGKNIPEVFASLATADPGVRSAVVTGLASSWPAGSAPKLTDDGEKAVEALIVAADPASRAKLLKLVAGWGVKGLDAQIRSLTDSLLATATDAKASSADRIAAARQVIEFRPADDAAAAKLLAAINTQSPPEFVTGLFDVLGSSQGKGLGAAVVAKLPDLTPAGRTAALRLVLSKPDAAKAFLDAVDAGKARFDALALDQKTALANHPDKSLATRAAKLLAAGGGLPDPNRQKVIDELHSVLTATGDVPNGKKMFTAHCAKCHKHSGEGQQIGPDLTGMAVHPKEELLVHIMDPSRSVEGNYKAFTVQTADGRTLTGLLAAETKTSVELIDAENKRHAIARDDIDSLKESTKSLMPEGFEKQMKPAEVADLLEFLTQKGKFVPVPLDRVATVVTTKGMFHDAENTTERMVFRDWKPKEFAGVPFVLVDPQGDRLPNAVMLNSPNGAVPPKMPETVALPFEGKAKAVHLLGGVSGWGAMSPGRGPVSMVVRLTYADGKKEDHPLRDGVEMADYIRRIDVPGSQFAFDLRGRQVRYLSVPVNRADVPLKAIEFVKGRDRTAPVVMAVTVESP